MRRPPPSLLLLALLLLLTLPGLGSPGFWAKDEARYAQSAREMRRSGDYLVPTLGGEIRLKKPPLFYWLVAGSQAVLGETETAARLPGALAGVATALLVAWFAGGLAGRRAGLLAGLVYATSVFGFGMARLAHPDGLLNLWVTAAMVLLHRSRREDYTRKAPLLLAWLAMGLGFLSKGPHGVILPVLLLLAYLLVERDLRAFRKTLPLRGLLLALAPFLLWGGAVLLREGRTAVDTLYRETVGRFSGSESFHPEPAWFFVPVLLGGFLPWTLWLPAVFRRRGRPAGGLWLAVWAAGTLVFFSIGRNKATGYVLPAVPPLAVAVGIALADLRRGRALRVVAVLHLAAAGVLAGAALAGAGPAKDLPRLPHPGPAWWTGGLLLLTLAGTGMLAAAGRPRAAAATTLAGAAAVLLCGALLLAPEVNARRSCRDAGLAVRSAVRPGDLFVNLEGPRAGLLWYADHPVDLRTKIPDLARMWDGPRRILVYGDRKHLARLEKRLGRSLAGHVLWRREDGEVLVFANRSP